MSLSKTSWSKWIIIACMLPAILINIVVGIIPSLATLFFSFTDISGIPHVSWKFIGLENYKEFFYLRNSRDTLDTLKRTIVFALSVTVIQNVLALLVALLLNNKALRVKSFVRAIVFLPTILGVTVVCYSWSLLFTLDGPASIFLAWFGGFSSFFGSNTAAFPLVILVQIWLSMGYAMVIYLAGLQNIPTELYEAGAIDGANATQTFRRITFPLLWPIVIVNVLLSVIGSLSVVQTILLTTNGTNNTSTLAMVIFGTAFGIGSFSGVLGFLRQGFASAQSMVLFVMILVATICVQSFLRRFNKE